MWTYYETRVRQRDWKRRTVSINHTDPGCSGFMSLLCIFASLYGCLLVPFWLFCLPDRSYSVSLWSFSENISALESFCIILFTYFRSIFTFCGFQKVFCLVLPTINFTSYVTLHFYFCSTCIFCLSLQPFVPFFYSLMSHVGLFVSHVVNLGACDLFYVYFVSHRDCFVSLPVTKAMILDIIRGTLGLCCVLAMLVKRDRDSSLVPFYCSNTQFLLKQYLSSCI